MEARMAAIGDIVKCQQLAVNGPKILAIGGYRRSVILQVVQRIALLGIFI